MVLRSRLLEFFVHAFQGVAFIAGMVTIAVYEAVAGAVSVLSGFGAVVGSRMPRIRKVGRSSILAGSVAF